jgi:Leucine-rich repeat (LRR) protein
LKIDIRAIIAFVLVSSICPAVVKGQFAGRIYIPKAKFIQYDSRLVERIKSRIDVELWLWPRKGIFNIDSLSNDTPFDSIQTMGIAGKSKIPKILSKFTRVDSLILLDVSINRIPRRLRKLKNLHSLTIFHTKCRTRIRLTKNSSIKKLSIVFTQPVVLPRTYKKFSSLELLSLTDNTITDFPNGMRKNRTLREVNLQRNWIDLSKIIKRNPYIEKLRLHENRIVKVPESIENLPSLKLLTLNRNRIEEFSPAFSRLCSLERLSVYHNKLTEIPKSFYGLQSLKDLEFVYNDITAIDQNIRNWNCIEVLNLSHNKISTLSPSIGALYNLTRLDLSNNFLVSLPDSIGRLVKLRYLHVNNNRLVRLPLSLSLLSNVEDLDISKNALTNFPFTVHDLSSLKILAFHHNYFDIESKGRIREFVKRADR